MIAARPMGRRAVLRLSLAGATLLAAGGGLAAWLSAGYASLLEPGDVPVALSIKEFAVVRALVDALFPEEECFPSGLSLGVAQRVDEELWAASDFTRDALKDGIQLMEHLPPLYGKAHRFTALDREARAEVFDAMLRSRSSTVRQIAVALKQMTHLFYYGHERVWPNIHYDGPFIEQEKPPASSIVYAGIVRERRGA